MSKYDNKYYQKNKEKLIRYQEKYNQKNKKMIKVSRKARYEGNKEKILEDQKEYRDNHKKQIKIKNFRYRQKIKKLKKEKKNV